jgi:hypothetical protein
MIHWVLNPNDNQGPLRPVARFAAAERIREVKLEGKIATFMASKVLAIAPAIREKICGSDRQNGSFSLPNSSGGNFDKPPIPANFISLSATMILLRHDQWIDENPGGVIMCIAGSVTLTPRRKGLPAEGNDNLLAPIRT